MLEIILSTIKKSGPVTPGPQNLAAGNSTIGYYGPVTSANFFTSANLVSQVGLTASNTLNATPDWFKFSWQGKIQYIPKLPIQQNVTWSQLNTLGIVYAAQNKLVTLNGQKFRVRLISSSSSDPYTGAANTTDPAACAGSEFNSLIYRVCATNPGTQVGANFENFSQADLGFTSAAGSECICIEAVSYDATARSIGRGGNGDFSALYMPEKVNGNGNLIGWRPVLEYVSG